MGTYYFGGTHPNAKGYTALWQTIGEELGLLPVTEPSSDAIPEDWTAITCLGCNVDEIGGDTALDAVLPDGISAYPMGTSWYYTWNPFTDELPYGAFIETHRNSDGTGEQFARAQYGSDLISLSRNYANGRWSPWRTM